MNDEPYTLGIQKHLFLHQLTQNMMTDCWLNYKFSARKLQVHYMLRTQIVLLIDARISASEKNLPAFSNF